MGSLGLHGVLQSKQWVSSIFKRYVVLLSLVHLAHQIIPLVELRIVLRTNWHLIKHSLLSLLKEVSITKLVFGQLLNKPVFVSEFMVQDILHLVEAWVQTYLRNLRAFVQFIVLKYVTFELGQVLLIDSCALCRLYTESGLAKFGAMRQLFI